MAPGSPVPPRVEARPPGAERSPAAARRRVRTGVRGGVVLVLQARALVQQKGAAASLAVCTELALLGRAQRVSIGFRWSGRMRVTAMSGATDIRQRQNLVRLIAAAMDEAADQQKPVVWPQPRAGAPLIALAQSELARVGGHPSVLALPILSRDRPIGALVAERELPFDEDAIRLFRDAALLVGPILEIRDRLDAPWTQRAAGWLAALREPAGAGRRDRNRFGRPAVVTGVAVAVAAAAFVPVPDRVVAPARIEGEIQRVVAAPFDGFVREVDVRPGELVVAGQPLLVLDDRDLRLERERALSEIAQLDKAYGDAFANEDSARIAMARARLDQARAALALVDENLGRSRLIAPFNGVVISGDLMQSIGMPVKRGQELMTVAPDRGFRAVIEADEQDIARLAVGQQARILFGAWTGEPVSIRIDRIAPVAAVIGDRNVFELEGAAPALEPLRPGLRGVARIEIGQRPWLAIQGSRLARWFERTTWRVLG